MKIAYSWLKEFIALDLSPQELAEKLTSIGLEVESVTQYEQIRGNLEGLVIAEVLTCEKHPDADKLSLTTVDAGGGTILPVVCGAPNVAAGQKVVLAKVDTTLYPMNGEPFTIKKAKIRGEFSEGMICAEDEIGLGSSHTGILVLDTDLPNGTPASAYFQPHSDFIFEIGLTPNRADAASHLGVARDLRALLDQPMCFPTPDAFLVDNHNYPIAVKLEDPVACPRYSGLTISNLTIKESPKWLKDRLQSIGQTPINNVVDVSNFVLHELGQPLHAFDADKITGKTILVKTLPEGSVFVTLDGKERKLSNKDLMICDGDSKGMCIGGVFGGIDSGISAGTKNIFLESAYFSPEYIRKTSQYHDLKTDAAFRFERGTDPNMTLLALKRAALLIKEVAGGEISSEVVDCYPQPIWHFEFRVTYKNIYRLIGKKPEKAFIRQLLQRLEIALSKEDEEGFTVSVPPYRVDVQREADVIEDIARFYGFDQLELMEHLGSSFLSHFPETDGMKLQHLVSQLLAVNGFFEMMNNSLTKPSYARLIDENNEIASVPIQNYQSEDMSVMRQCLLFGGLESIVYNLNRKQKDLRLFEFGQTYQLLDHPSTDNRLDKYRENYHLAMFLCGSKHSETWLIPSQKNEFHDLALSVQKVLKRMNAGNFSSAPISSPVFHYGLDYKVNQQTIARLGSVRKDILKEFDIKEEVFYAEVYWEKLLSLYSSDIEFKEISKFPEVRRDLSLVLDKKITFDELKNLAFGKEKRLLKEINVFDVYEGPNIEQGKKAYALSFILQDDQKTLEDKDIDKVMQKLMQSFESELGAFIRK